MLKKPVSFHSQKNAECFPKRQLFFAEAVSSSAPEQNEVQRFRESIEEKSPTELMREFQDQTAQLWEKQQVIYEVIEDLNEDKSIPQEAKNQLVVNIATELESNQQLVIQEEYKMALGSHLQPGKNVDMWLTKVSLLAGTLGQMQEEMDEEGVSQFGKLSKMLKWVKVVFALIKGEVIVPKSPEQQAGQATELPVEEPPEQAKKLSESAQQNILIQENQANADAGYLTLQIGSEIRLLKFDGSEITTENGQPAPEQSNVLGEYLQKKSSTLANIAVLTTATSNAQKVQLAQALIQYQKTENNQPSPVDVALVINDNWNWLMTQDAYKNLSSDQKRQKLLDASDATTMNALKNRYETVRTQEKNTGNARRMVSEAISQLAREAAQQGVDQTSDLEAVRDQARSQPEASGILSSAAAGLTAYSTRLTTNNPFEDADKLSAYQQKVQHVFQILNQQRQALNPQTS